MRVCIYRRADRVSYQAEWTDPITGRRKTRSLKTADSREAARRAAKLEAELESGEDLTHLSWSAALAAYRAEKWPGLAVTSRAKIETTLRLIASAINPQRAATLGTVQLSRMVHVCREEGLSESTIRGHLRNAMALLRWCRARGIVRSVPSPPTLGRALTPMRGRPITAEEFDRISAATEQVVGRDRAPEWRRLLEGLWLTGLRLGEAIALHWTDDTAIRLDLTGAEFPMFRIQAAAEKGRKFRLLPMTQEAAAFFQRTNPRDRRGHVFRPLSATGTRATMDLASGVITQIGEAAKVAVSSQTERPGRPARPKWASAHDLRRAFGARLALQVRAPLLQLLMRHESIQTTLQFYVGSDAEAAARELWNLHSAAQDTVKRTVGEHADFQDGNENTPETYDTQELRE